MQLVSIEAKGIEEEIKQVDLFPSFNLVNLVVDNHAENQSPSFSMFKLNEMSDGSESIEDTDECIIESLPNCAFKANLS